MVYTSSSCKRTEFGLYVYPRNKAATHRHTVVVYTKSETNQRNASRIQQAAAIVEEDE